MNMRHKRRHQVNMLNLLVIRQRLCAVADGSCSRMLRSLSDRSAGANAAGIRVLLTASAAIST